jgi:hypothetical protein
MDSDPVRVLFCLLDGENALFQVKVNINETVFNLKEQVLDKKPNALSNVDANNLLLYKVSFLRPGTESCN